MIEILWWLLVAHTITDALLQDGKLTSIGAWKDPFSPDNPCPSHWWYWMFLHGVLNGLGVWVVLWCLTGRSLLLPMVGEVFAHSAIDYGKCKGGYGVHVDQGLHLLSKVAWSVVAWHTVGM